MVLGLLSSGTYGSSSSMPSPRSLRKSSSSARAFAVAAATRFASRASASRSARALQLRACSPSGSAIAT